MRFKKNESLNDFQLFINVIYASPDDRLFSLWDLISQLERFTMRAIKGIRKNDQKKLTYNLIIALSWLMAISNRLHIQIENIVWTRFPYFCSYCGKKPCECKKIKPKKRKQIKGKLKDKPKNISELQIMFGKIYPQLTRTISDAGVHLAEETGELSEAVHVFLGEHKDEQFMHLEEELADYVSCLFGVANSASIDISSELVKQYYKNCHICHQKPCACKFSEIATFTS